VVIGAGVGDYLRQPTGAMGAQVCIEQHFMVGGYCSTFRRKDTPSMLPRIFISIGNPSTIQLTPGRLGVTNAMDKNGPGDCFHFPDARGFLYRRILIPISKAEE